MIAKLEANGKGRASVLRLGLGIRKMFFSGVWWAQPWAAGVRGEFGQCSQTRGLSWGGDVWSRELGSVMWVPSNWGYSAVLCTFITECDIMRYGVSLRSMWVSWTRGDIVPKRFWGGFGEHVEAAPLQFSNSQNAAVVILAPVNSAAGSSSWGAHGAAQSELAEGSSCQKVTWPYRQSLVALLQQNQKHCWQKAVLEGVAPRPHRTPGVLGAAAGCSPVLLRAKINGKRSELSEDLLGPCGFF